MLKNSKNIGRILRLWAVVQSMLYIPSLSFSDFVGSWQNVVFVVVCCVHCTCEQSEFLLGNVPLPRADELDVVNEVFGPMNTAAGMCRPLQGWTWRGWMSLMFT